MILFILAATVVLYSFFINFSFGHKQYWRVGLLIEYFICAFRATKKDVRQRWKAEKISLGKTGNSLFSAVKKTSAFSSLPDDLLFKTLTYLDAFHLIAIIGRLSRKFLQASRHQLLWEELRIALLNSAQKICHADRKLVFRHNLESRLLSSSFPSNPISVYFKMSNEILSSLASEFCIYRKTACTILDKSIYDISKFLDEHPGGPAILLEWNGKNATKLFRMAHHSSFAYNLRKSMLLWSATPISGRKGVPKLILHETKHRDGGG